MLYLTILSFKSVCLELISCSHLFLVMVCNFLVFFLFAHKTLRESENLLLDRFSPVPYDLPCVEVLHLHCVLAAGFGLSSTQGRALSLALEYCTGSLCGALTRWSKKKMWCHSTACAVDGFHHLSSLQAVSKFHYRFHPDKLNCILRATCEG